MISKCASESWQDMNRFSHRLAIRLHNSVLDTCMLLFLPRRTLVDFHAKFWTQLFVREFAQPESMLTSDFDSMIFLLNFQGCMSRRQRQVQEKDPDSKLQATRLEPLSLARSHSTCFPDVEDKPGPENSKIQTCPEGPKKPKTSPELLSVTVTPFLCSAPNTSNSSNSIYPTS